ncbi:MAG: bacillithiol system redox-active protein YtxJ [Gracilimonas sp.]|nr:bacillithiol system redox-active protein YtxJ [Gracilimonas sp.]
MISGKEVKNMWNNISGIEDLNGLLERSEKQPQLIYKHSPSCGVSFIAKQELEAEADEFRNSADLHLVNVIQDRPVSNAIAQEFGIRHESPQVLVLKNGKVVWEGSHWQIKSNNILPSLKEN